MGESEAPQFISFSSTNNKAVTAVNKQYQQEKEKENHLARKEPRVGGGVSMREAAVMAMSREDEREKMDLPTNEEDNKTRKVRERQSEGDEAGGRSHGRGFGVGGRHARYERHLQGSAVSNNARGSQISVGSEGEGVVRGRRGGRRGGRREEYYDQGKRTESSTLSDWLEQKLTVSTNTQSQDPVAKRDDVIAPRDDEQYWEEVWAYEESLAMAESEAQWKREETERRERAHRGGSGGKRDTERSSERDRKQLRDRESRETSKFGASHKRTDTERVYYDDRRFEQPNEVRKDHTRGNRSDNYRGRGRGSRRVSRAVGGEQGDRGDHWPQGQGDRRRDHHWPQGEQGDRRRDYHWPQGQGEQGDRRRDYHWPHGQGEQGDRRRDYRWPQGQGEQGDRRRDHHWPQGQGEQGDRRRDHHWPQGEQGDRRRDHHWPQGEQGDRRRDHHWPQGQGEQGDRRRDHHWPQGQGEQGDRRRDHHWPQGQGEQGDRRRDHYWPQGEQGDRRRDHHWPQGQGDDVGYVRQRGLRQNQRQSTHSTSHTRQYSGEVGINWSDDTGESGEGVRGTGWVERTDRRGRGTHIGPIRQRQARGAPRTRHEPRPSDVNSATTDRAPPQPLSSANSSSTEPAPLAGEYSWGWLQQKGAPLSAKKVAH